MSDDLKLTLVAATQNPAKINAVKQAFERVFSKAKIEVKGVPAQSGVADQPIGDQETKQGALNRIQDAKRLEPGADFYIGLEAGIDDGFTYAWLIIEDNPSHGEIARRGMSRSASLQLPPDVIKQVQQGIELGDVMDTVFATTNIKQKGGAISLLTQQRLSRSQVYQDALILALAPFLNPEHYESSI